MILLIWLISYVGLLAGIYYIAMAANQVWQANGEIQKIKLKWNLQKNLGWNLLLIAVANMIPHPFPFIGPGMIFFSCLCVLFGCVFLFRYYVLLKVGDFLALAEKTNGYLTLVVVMRRLGFSHDIAEKTFRNMVDSKHLIILNPDKLHLPEILFFARSFGGKLPGNKNAVNDDLPLGTDDEIRGAHSHMTSKRIDDINMAILEETRE
jgi:hypothetical protein